MTIPMPLNPVQVPLEGINLIEASAGTGKTWTISGLYVRLIVEQNIPVESLLVVTFTEAATQELRDRIRSKLVQTLESFETGASDDHLIRGMLDQVSDNIQASRQLSAAIRNFDQAAIFTIHGFCQRILADYAFESSQPFDAEVITEQSALIQEVVDDFWRKKQADTPPWLIRYLFSKGVHPDSLLADIHSYIGKQHLDVEQPVLPGLDELHVHYLSAYQEAAATWQSNQVAIRDLLLENPVLKKNIYQPASMVVRLESLSDYFSTGLTTDEIALDLPKGFEYFTQEKLKSSVKKGQTVPAHVFFEHCQELFNAYVLLVSALVSAIKVLKVELLHFANNTLSQRKRARSQLYFDDLLNNIHQALHGEGGESLAQRVRSAYTAALIDEFQDTDPVQYAIFNRLFGNGDYPVFFVGDPKQAIYSFRGADIFAYLEAQQKATRRYTLNANWRSTPTLIEAVNQLFSRVDTPFIYEQIAFHPVQPAQTQREALTVQGDDTAALRFLYLAGEAPDENLSKTKAMEPTAIAVANEIVRLLGKGKATIGERFVTGGDIAVLVRTHDQADKVAHALRKRRVPCVQQMQTHVFATDEAVEVERILLAIQQPSRASLVRAALATHIFSGTSRDLQQLDEQDSAWETCVSRFYHYHQQWISHGFMSMFKALLSDVDAPQNLLALEDGERRLTNVLHLMELLHQAAHDHFLGMEGVIKWLGDQRQAPNSHDDWLLRLESDADRVKIVTLHKSKGLEYPIVFCPYLWGESQSIQYPANVVYHDPDRNNQAVLAMSVEKGSSTAEQAEKELKAENRRLLYVGLTRAVHRCYIVWGNMGSAVTSALGALLPGVSRESLAPLVEASAGRIHVGDADITGHDWYTGPALADTVLMARSFTRALTPKWRVGSFSGLISGHEEARPDYDALDPGASAVTTTAPENVEEGDAGAGIYDFPKGAQAGSCLHHIYEHWDFTCTDRAALDDQVQETLQLFGFSDDWTPVVAENVEHVLNAALPGEPPLSLSRVPPAARVNEMEFHFSVEQLSAHGLMHAITTHAPELANKIGGIEFRSLQGYLHGFIDLIFEVEGRFYVADYKSNHLGEHRDDYTALRMQAEMKHHHYYLQYIIYCIALHRYLRQRMPSYQYETHFGGVYYLFLRGMRAGTARGVYHDRLPEALIHALDKTLAEAT